VELTLTPQGAEEPEGTIHWDPESGEISGDLAGEVERLIDAAIAEGAVIGHPYPTSYRIFGPRRRRRELALVLGQRWRIPEPLADAYPAPQKAPDSDLPFLF